MAALLCDYEHQRQHGKNNQRKPDVHLSKNNKADNNLIEVITISSGKWWANYSYIKQIRGQP
jgi:hypothetical protein